MLKRVFDDFVLCFRDIMMGTCHNPENSGVSDDEICRMIYNEMATTIREAISGDVCVYKYHLDRDVR